MIMRRRLACCTRDMREVSIDFDEQERIMTYNGLESCILNGHSFDNESGTSRGEGKDDQCQDEWNSPATPRRYNVKEKLDDGSRLSDVEAMKEKFAKLLLGEDITGGTKGVSTALALSNAITNLAASVFGELWKLAPLPEERKIKWKREMDWLLSPTNHMVELVPAKQNGTNGRTLEIMTPKARADVHMNLPALRKLDSMLIETLDSMVDTEFWYAEVGSRAEGRSRSAGQSKRWWLPSPRIGGGCVAWKEKITEQNNGKSPVRTSWSFMKDPLSELDKTESLVYQAEVLLQQLKNKYPNLPQTFLDVTKIQYGKDVGHAILEAYSRVLANLAFSILSRIGDILQEDVMSNPNSPVAMSHLVGARIPGISDSPMLDRVRHSLIHQLNSADGKSFNASDIEAHYEEAKISSVSATPSRSRVWCIGREACHSVSAQKFSLT
ncbi:Rop guanine nucleotide exchange factor 14 [Sesamum angolense]|uniref:Rop guanine nucleotide exchange factor 14 n=1 Tax=Sesamum angolense TaxID=2727404 RepID=A0AAE1TAY6_9LAMI|nr:Rop guanine nucleotide exchange factor 14 [Sesamum angolense]